MNEIIHVHIYEPHKPNLFGKASANERSQLHIYTCENKDQCDAFKRGQCINVGNVFGSRCPIGRVNKSSGYTRRAQKYHSQIREWKDRYKDQYRALDSAPKRITKVPGGWMLPYSHMDMNKAVPFKSHSAAFISGCAFLSDDDFNKEVFEKILAFRPMALMGGEIKDYQKTVVPKFLHDFQVNYPAEFSELASENDSAKSLLNDLNFIGRKAYLNTVKPGSEVKLGTKIWLWDGQTISKTNRGFMVFEPCEWEECYAEFKPSDKATVEITSNEQVCENTLFAD